MKLDQLNPILVISIVTLSIQANALSGNETDHLSLLEFKRGIANDPFGVLTSWNDSTNFCYWHGVTCSPRHRQRVSGLQLRGLGLRGSIAPHLGNLTFLGLLDLSNNTFQGSIPPQVGGLSRLRSLYLANNSLRGEIPLQLFNCTGLRVLDLGWNGLSGGLSPRVGSLSKLERLLLGSNRFTGAIPSSIGNLSSLEQFYAHYDSFEGRIPDDIGKLERFTILAAGGNKLSGELPLSLYNISSLAVISLSVNNLNGALPTDIGLSLPNLIGLAISNNEFSGPIPISLSNASKLQALQLSRNNFVGSVPKDLGNRLVDLWGLGLSSNYLGSNSSNDLEFLESLTNVTKLRILDLGNNRFGGVLPTSIANLSIQLRELSLGSNQVHGNIPHGLEKYTNLNVLDVSSNLFTGKIPSSFGKLQNIQGIYLDRNGLSGPIPSSFGNLTRLTQLYSSQNRINGTIPTSIGKCKNLQYLDLSGNALAGPIPKELTGLSSLSLLLNLSRNFLTGDVPPDIGDLKNVNAIDFAENDLSGSVPATVGDCESLEYLDLQGNSFRGVIPSSMASLKGLTHLDLSRNNFSGSIPKDLQRLRFLVYFNASFNDLDGEVPVQGVFGNSSAMSLIGNHKLCGGISSLALPLCPDIKPKKWGISRTTKVIIIICSSFLCLLMLSCSIFLYRIRKSKKNEEPKTESVDPYRLSRVSYKTLHDATGGFSPDNLIGSGSFGNVYKGSLDQSERLVAVKVIDTKQRGGSKSFVAECEALRNVRHRNLVKVIISCSSIDHKGNDFRAIVFEFVDNSSLDEWLHRDVARKLSFAERLNIAIDVASAVNYLHVESNPPLVHCDLKPSNVILDSDMVAHVGDFGLARILSTVTGNQSSTIGLKGSIGYAAPEYGVGGKASREGDVYSYGILLLEMFTGKRPTHELFKEGLNIHQFVKAALPKRLLEIVDQTLQIGTVVDTAATYGNNDRSRNCEQCLVAVLEIGLACSAEASKDRIKMKEVVRELGFVKNDFLGNA